ncbi:MAG: hypothetical protein IPH54_17885 [Rhodoferax sp.]|nr:hypothetical protein [Rhodoferax sp.]
MPIAQQQSPSSQPHCPQEVVVHTRLNEFLHQTSHRITMFWMRRHGFERIEHRICFRTQLLRMEKPHRWLKAALVLVGAAAFAAPLVLADVLAGVLTTGVLTTGVFTAGALTAGFAVFLAAGLAMVLAVVVMM